MREMRERVENILDSEIPRWEKQLPEEADVIMIAKQYSARYGCKIDAWYRLPIRALNGTYALNPNAIKLDGNGYMDEVPTGQVVPAYVNPSNPHDIREAVGKKAAFLLVDKQGEHYVVQSSGVYHFPNMHGYIVGSMYYLAPNGTPTTDKTDQQLFYVLNQYDIDIRLADVYGS